MPRRIKQIVCDTVDLLMRSQVMYINLSYIYIPVNYYNITVPIKKKKKENIMKNVGTDSYSGLKYVNYKIIKITILSC